MRRSIASLVSLTAACLLCATIHGASSDQPAKSAACKPLTEASGTFTPLAVSPDGRTFAALPPGRHLEFRDAHTGKLLAEPLFLDPPVGDKIALFSPDGSSLLVGGWSSSVTRVEVPSGKVLGKPLRHAGPINAMTLSPDGRTLLVGTGNWAIGNESRLWEVATWKLRRPAKVHRSAVMAVAFRPDGKAYLTGDFRPAGEIWMWDTATDKALLGPLRHQSNVWSLAFGPDGSTILSGSRDKTARLWDATTGKPIGEPLKHPGEVVRVAFSPDGKLLLTGTDAKTVHFWDEATRKPLAATLSVGGEVTLLAFGPDGKSILVGWHDREEERGGLGRWAVPGLDGKGAALTSPWHAPAKAGS
jgi:WD40 repeat protein